jgi:hypothetical protein
LKKILIDLSDEVNITFETQIPFTSGIALVFLISALLTISAIIVSALRESEDVGRNSEQPENNKFSLLFLQHKFLLLPCVKGFTHDNLCVAWEPEEHRV